MEMVTLMILEASWQACQRTATAAQKRISGAARPLHAYKAITLSVLAITCIATALYFVLDIPALDHVSFAFIILSTLLIAGSFTSEVRSFIFQAKHSEESADKERRTLERIVTDRTNELLSSEKKRLEDSGRFIELGQLSQGLLHDLINPLSSVSLYVEKLAENGNDPIEAREIVRKAVAASKRMRSFMNDVRHCLSDRHIESERIADLRREVAIVRDVMVYKARLAGVRLDTDDCEEISLAIHPIRAHQLLLNLVTNAIEACSETPVDSKITKVVSISAYKTEENMIIKVTDNGCGMSESDIERSFKHPFTTKKDGTGIGLQTILTIVEKELNGTISVESARGLGTTFIIKVQNPKSTMIE